MPLNEKIKHVVGGTKSARDKLNPTIDAANSVSRIVGDGMVRVSHGMDGVAIGLNIDQVAERLPRWSRVRYGVAAGLDARSDNCAWIRPGSNDARFCYVQEAAVDFPFSLTASAPQPVSVSNEAQYIKVFFSGRVDPVVFAGDIVPYVLAKDPANAETPYGIALGSQTDLPITTTIITFNVPNLLHSGWVKSGVTGALVSTSLSDSGSSVVPRALAGEVLFGVNAPADAILQGGAPGVTDSWDVGPEHSGVGAKYIYGMAFDYYQRMH